MDEQKWIEQVLAGDMQSFSLLVSKYEKMAYTLAYRIMENKEEAEEVVQDAFVKMYNALPGFQFGSKFSTWFYRIVYHAALSAQRARRTFVDYDQAGGDTLSDGEIDSATSLLEREDRKEIISKVMEKLPSDEATLLTLYYLEECSVDDIHQITGLTSTNVKTKLFRGRKHFYEIIQKMMKHETSDIL